MAYFTTSDEIRTLKYLGYPPNYLPQLRTFQQLAYDRFGDAIVDEVESILDDLDTLNDLQTTYATDSSSSLIRADVLEWNPQGRQANLLIRMSSFKQQLATLLNMPVVGGYSSTRVYRS